MRGRAATLMPPGCLAALFAWLLPGAVGEASAAIPASERAALIALYDSTRGAQWIHRSGWLGASGTECAWYGVACDSGAAHVTSLTLSGNNLQGPIPPDIGTLTVLATLDLGHNGLTGSIPAEIGDLSALVTLYLGNTQVSGPIPPEIGDLKALESLELCNTQLSGPIPPEIGGLSALVNLYLCNTQVSGSIPPEIGNLRALVRFDCYNNPLSGSIPPAIGNLKNLTELSLSNDNLIGSIPPEIGGLTSLKFLRIDSNPLGGPIPPEIGNLTDLVELFLHGSQLSGSIPPEIGHLAALKTLYLAYNQLSGSIPPEIGNLSALEWMDLHDNQLSGAIPSTIGKMAALGEMDLSSNQLAGPIPPEIGDLAALAMLDLHGNQLSGPIPPTIGSAKALCWANLSDNQLAGPFPAAISTLPALQTLDLHGNQLSGPIPPEIGDLVMGGGTDAGSLYLDHNQLSGPIPPEIGKLTMGTYKWAGTLHLDHNQLSGPIPPEIVGLRHASDLYLDHNLLSGPIPPEIGSLRLGDSYWGWAGSLHLEDNQLSGPIPAQLGNLAIVSGVYLQGNQLEGPIPATLTKLTSLLDGQSDLRWNALYTDDAALRAFLNSKQEGGDWESTQTVAPTGLATGGATIDSVPLSWSPIVYAGDTGGYRLWYGTQGGGPYNLGGTTANKAVSASAVSGLSPGTTYYFALDTLSEPHANNQNTVLSERTAEVSATTAAGGVDWHSLTVLSNGPGIVSSAPGGIACGGVCSASFAPAAPVTLTAAPAAGSTFLGWGGACAGTAPTCDLVMDVERTVTVSFSTPPTSYYTVTPCRAYDSRAVGETGALAAGTDHAILVAGYCGIPATAKAVSLNVTVVGPSADGHLRLYASGTRRPGTSSINYASGQTRANNAVVSLGTDGALIVHVKQPSGTAQVVIDVNGYFQ
jgi:Leucine-rich repeat (LRR) protein